MARITTRDCERIVPNRFELVLLAARRAHELWNGTEPQVADRDEKPTVLALREIALGQVDPAVLRQRLIERLGPGLINVSRAPIGALAWNSPPSGSAPQQHGGNPRTQVNEE